MRIRTYPYEGVKPEGVVGVKLMEGGNTMELDWMSGESAESRSPGITGNIWSGTT